jgi:hypothetical protein
MPLAGRYTYFYGPEYPTKPMEPYDYSLRQDLASYMMLAMLIKKEKLRIV